MFASPFESPAPILRSKQKRKRRPTRTPKPITPGKSRLCSPSPFLDRSSFKRKKLLFNHAKPRSSSNSNSEASEYTDSDPNDSEYDINQDLTTQYDALDEEESKETKPFASDHQLVHDIENLSITSNQSTLLRNARSSVKTNKVQTPNLFDHKRLSKIKKKKTTTKEKEKVKETTHKHTTVRITKSNRVFTKCHAFGDVLVAPLECGSGCPLYRSTWKSMSTVTKLMPCFENEEFSKEENVDNALREYELHVDMYRRGVKHYGVDECPVVSILGCVTLKRRNKQYLAFVMPALHCNLTQFVSKYRKLNDSEAHMLLRCGLRFLENLKEAQMVHNDIKPENVFVDVVFDANDEAKIKKFVFGDFGCAALKTEEFPFGSLTGTVTMWDLEALGPKHGKEDGFSDENDLYGMIGCVLVGVYGGDMLEELLEEENENWEETEWDQYTDLVRLCRAKMSDRQFMQQEWKYMKCDDKMLEIVLMQIAEPRKKRMTLEEIIELMDYK
eukprot:189946_1